MKCVSGHAASLLRGARVVATRVSREILDPISTRNACDAKTWCVPSAHLLPRNFFMESQEVSWMPSSISTAPAQLRGVRGVSVQRAACRAAEMRSCLTLRQGKGNAAAAALKRQRAL
jgi:hypothetical protein